MIENSIVYRNFKGKYEYFPLLKAEGSLIWDRSGKEYIDFSSMCESASHVHPGSCPNEFETSYAPDRPETVYCEQCYQAEVA